MKSFWQNSDVMNREVSLRRLGGNETLLATLAQFFLEDAPNLMRQLDEAHAAGDLKTVAHRAHSLKGLSSTFEAIPFLNRSREVESMALTGQVSQLDENIRDLKVEFDQLVEQLQKIAPQSTSQS